MQPCIEKGFGAPAGSPARLMLLLGALHALRCWDTFRKKKGGGRFQIHDETRAYHISCVFGFGSGCVAPDMWSLKGQFYFSFRKGGRPWPLHQKDACIHLLKMCPNSLSTK